MQGREGSIKKVCVYMQTCLHRHNDRSRRKPTKLPKAPQGGEILHSSVLFIFLLVKYMFIIGCNRLFADSTEMGEC